MSHSYIIELKYTKGKDSSERIEQLRRQAIEQTETLRFERVCAESDRSYHAT